MVRLPRTFKNDHPFLFKVRCICVRMNIDIDSLLIKLYR